MHGLYVVFDGLPDCWLHQVRNVETGSIIITYNQIPIAPTAMYLIISNIVKLIML